MRIVLLLLVCLVAAGCSQDAAEPAGDCPDTIRLADVVYTWHGRTEEKATGAHDDAEVAGCDDAGEDPQGSIFPDDPTQVRTWTFAGHPPEQVLGVASDDGAFGVFIADSVTPERRERISTDLTTG